MDKKLFISALITFFLINLLVELIPDGPYEAMFKNSLMIAERAEVPAEVLVFGDSKATSFHHTFFNRPTFSFACQNNSILYSKFLNDNLKKNPNNSFEVIILFLGANNYNENGIFVTRDFGLRRLSSIKDTHEIFFLENGLSNSLEIIISNIIPIYGRRMELREFGTLKRMLLSKYDKLLPQGMRPLDYNWDKKNKTIDTNEDIRYLLTYKRSVYNNFKLSKLHTYMLEQLIAENNSSSIIIVQLPIKEQMYQLQKNMTNNVFDDYLATLSIDNDNVYSLDLRGNTDYEFNDINHLSKKGSFDLTQEILNPLIEKIITNN